MKKIPRYFDGPQRQPLDSEVGAELIAETFRNDQKNDSEPNSSKKSKIGPREEPRDQGSLGSTVDPEIVKRYEQGKPMRMKAIKGRFYREKYSQKEEKIRSAHSKAAISDLMLHEEAGYLEPDEGEFSYRISQNDITKAVDIASATKHFALDLPKFGPYRLNYSRNGRHLLLGGSVGHIAAFDWQSKQLHCETNVMETVRDVQWLHVETMFAVAQKKWTYIYDNQGVELHCLKPLHKCLRLEFLPFHFLLVGSSETSYLHWLDVSTGNLVQSFCTREGRLDNLCQNPANSVVLCAHAKGTVTMWAPTVKEPLVKMLCHYGPVRGLAVESTGQYMATAGADQNLRIWDFRTYKPLYAYKLGPGLSSLAFSQRKILAAAVGNRVQLLKNVCDREIDAPYLLHEFHSSVTDLQFCPHEDVLGVGHGTGFTSLLIPGAGNPNVDALENNPFQTKKQRREFEVKALLDKLQPETISLENTELIEVDQESLKNALEERSKLKHLKPAKIELKLKYKAKGKSGAKGKRSRKNKLKDEKLREHIRTSKAAEAETKTNGKETKSDQAPKQTSSIPILDRFKPKLH